MNREESGAEIADRPLRATRPLAGGAYPTVLAVYVTLFGFGAALLGLSEAGFGDFYVAGLMLLIAVSAGTFAGSLLEPQGAPQRFYLTLSILPGLLVARLAFSGMPLPFLDPFFVYLLLGATLLVFQQATRTASGLRAVHRAQWLRALVLGGALAAGFTILGLAVPLPPGTPPLQPVAVYVLALASAAFLDEFWFRGILQGGLAGTTSANWGWIAAAILFAAYGAPFGGLSALLVRAAYGAVLGALATRPGNLPVTLVARTAMVVALAILNPAVIGTALLV